MTSKHASFSVNGALVLAVLSLTACGGSNDFVSNQQTGIDGGIQVEGNPASDSNPNNSSDAGKYPSASGDFNNCSNAEMNYKCTIEWNYNAPSFRLSSGYSVSSQFQQRFVNKPDNWFRVIPYDKSLMLPDFDQNVDRKYSFEYLNNTFDGLTNAVHDAVMQGINTSNKHYIDFSSLKGYFAGNDLMLVRDVDVWGFQTIGQMIKFNNKRQIAGTSFFSVGQPLTEINGLAEATYNGIATGSLHGLSDTFAKVTANLSIPATGATQLTLNVTDTQITPNNLTAAGYSGSQPASQLDFARTLTWRDASKQFISSNGDVAARMFGPEGQEIGGIFSGTANGYQGAFGAKRQQIK